MRDFICGMVIGTANAVPGVSGSTMAIILNVYDKIFFAFSLRNIKKNFLFLASLAVGSIMGILLFSRVITYLYENYYVAVNYCFMGLVVGSLLTVFPGFELNKEGIAAALGFVVFAAMSWGFGRLGRD